MNTILDRDTNISFQAIKMKKTDAHASRQILQKYLSQSSPDIGQKAFEIFDKYITKEAEKTSKNKKVDFPIVYDYLCKMFWSSLDSLKSAYSDVERYFKQICSNLEYNPSANQEDGINDVIPINEYGPATPGVDGDNTSYFNQIEYYRGRREIIDFRNEDGTPYRIMAKEEGVSPATVRRAALIHRNGAKVENGEVPEEIKEKAQQLKSTFQLEASLDDIIKYIANNPAIIPKDIKILEQKLDTLSANFGIDREKIAAAGLNALVIYSADPKNTINKIDTTLRLIEETFGVNLNRKAYIEALLHQPSTLAYNPETIIDKMEVIKKYLVDKGIQMDQKLNVNELASHNVSNNEDTIQTDYIKTWVNSLWLLQSSTEYTIKKLNKLYSNNTSVDWPMIKKLFEEVVYKNEKEISDNIDKIVEEFAPYGLTRDRYEQAIKAQKPLARRNPQTVINNVRALAKVFGDYGLSITDCIDKCVQQPSLFNQKPDNIKNHIDAYRYVYKYKYNLSGAEAVQELISNCLSYSPLKIYLNGIIYPQVKNAFPELQSLKLSYLKSNIAEFFKNNPDAKCTIEIVDGDMKEDFIRTIDNFCLQEIGRKVFEYQLVDKPTVYTGKSKPQQKRNTNKESGTKTITKPQDTSTPTTTPEQKQTVPSTKTTQVQTPATPRDNGEVSKPTPEAYIPAAPITRAPKAKVLRSLMKGDRLLAQYEKKLTDFIECFKWEGDIADLREAFLSHTELFLMQLPVLSNNIDMLAKNLELEDRNILVECLLNKPTMFYSSPQELENIIKGLLAEFRQYGLTKDKLLKLYASKTTLLPPDTRLTDNLRAHLYVSQFDKSNKFHVDTVTGRSITVPEVNIYIDKIIIPQVSKEVLMGGKLTARNFSERMANYMKSHPLKEFNIEILNNDMADRFIAVMDDYCAENFNHGIFRYKKVSKVNPKLLEKA